MNKYELLQEQLRVSTKTWLITGVAGFIGSNILEKLLRLNQNVVGLDNFATGHKKNLEIVKSLVTNEQWSLFKFIEGDVCDIQVCQAAVKNVDYVLHQAALGSVPRSIADPITTNNTNISGFLNVLVAARDNNVEKFVYAASSSTYGDHPSLPKVEDTIGKPLSPYAVTKYVNELYADVFSRVYRIGTIGLRYFNVFGPRQDPNGAYAAVIPKWTASLINGDQIAINGDGKTSRDFCYIDNVVQANILAAMTTDHQAINNVYNVAVGHQTSLTQLAEMIIQELKRRKIKIAVDPIKYNDFRVGDVKHSLADISKIKSLLEYEPSHNISEGMLRAIKWYVESSKI